MNGELPNNAAWSWSPPSGLGDHRECLTMTQFNYLVLVPLGQRSQTIKCSLFVHFAVFFFFLFFFGLPAQSRGLEISGTSTELLGGSRSYYNQIIADKFHLVRFYSGIHAFKSVILVRLAADLWCVFESDVTACFPNLYRADSGNRWRHHCKMALSTSCDLLASLSYSGRSDFSEHQHCTRLGRRKK